MLAGHGTRPPLRVARFLYLAMALSFLASSVLSIGPTAVVQAEGPNAIQSAPEVTGCTTIALPRNDDGSSSAITMPFTANFFGTVRNTVFVNNNGNVTFDSVLDTFTPFGLANAARIIIAPYFADVDTTASASGVTTYGAGTYQGRTSFCVNWINVGYFSQHTDKLNSFQLVLVSRADRGTGDFDIVFNYDKILWETGDASNGTGGLGGSSARAGYSNGTAAGSFELPGSAVPGAFINGGPQALISGSRNSGGQQGRYRFEVTNGAPPTGAAINGTVNNEGGQPVANSIVSLCDQVRCLQATTTSSGQYSITGAPDGTWGLLAYPPPNSTLFADQRFGLVIQNGQLQPGPNPNLVLRQPRAPRQGVSLSPPLSPGTIGQTVVPSNAPLTLQVTGPSSCTVRYELSQGGVVFSSGTMSESPPGTYTATVGPFAPRHGPFTARFIWDCPGPSDPPDDFIDGYLDPSGTVRTTTGTVIQGATVTLFRSDSATGPFTAVPNGNILMSPSNRRNPDTTDAQGVFHWDTMPGFYKVRAEKAGCTAPGNPGVSFVETAVLPVPPEQLGLELILNCGGAGPSPTPTSGPTNIGGRGLTLTSQSPTSARLDWIDGTTETGYLVIRWSPTLGFFFPPAGVPISGSLSTFTDSVPAPGPFCYVLLPVGGNPPSTNNVLGLSDMACVYAGSGAGTGAPTLFSVRLGANNQAQLNWTNPATPQDHYFLLVTKFDGSAPQANLIQGSPTSTTHGTNGTSTCYTLVAASGPRVNGYTDTMCIVPGISSLGTASAPAVQSVDEVTNLLQQAVGDHVRKP